MILRACSLSALFVLALFGAQPARADVLEIAADGTAQWVTGANGRADMSADYGAPVAAGEVPLVAQTVVPEGAVADTQDHAAAIPPAFAAYIQQLAARFDLSPALLEALVWQESRWRADAVSPAGARGLAQLMPGTARELGVDPDNPYANLEGGARYLREQLDRFDGDLELALAAYNAGPGRVVRSGGIPPIRETQAYVAAIMGRLSNHSRSAE